MILIGGIWLVKRAGQEFSKILVWRPVAKIAGIGERVAAAACTLHIDESEGARQSGEKRPGRS